MTATTSPAGCECPDGWPLPLTTMLPCGLVTMREAHVIYCPFRPSWKTAPNLTDPVELEDLR